MHQDNQAYNDKQATGDKAICDLLSSEIDKNFKHAESKIWHAHPVWFLNGNPIVGYSKLKIVSGYFFGVVSRLKNRDYRERERSKPRKQDILTLIKLFLMIFIVGFKRQPKFNGIIKI